MDLDVAIIGSGPNGLAANVVMRQAFPDFKIVNFEQGEILGNIRGYPNVAWHSKFEELRFNFGRTVDVDPAHTPTTSEVIAYYEAWAVQNEVDIQQRTQINRIARHGNSIDLESRSASGGVVASARYVLLATGIAGNPLPLSFPIDDMSYVQRSFDPLWQGMKIALVGSGNSAYDAVIALAARNQIIWLTRGEGPRSPHPSVKEAYGEVLKRHHSNVEIRSNSEIGKVEANGVVKLRSGGSIGSVDVVVVLTGFNPISPVVVNSGLAVNENCLVLSRRNETSMRNLFAFGAALRRTKPNGKLDEVFIHNGNLPILKKTIAAIKWREYRFSIPFYPAPFMAKQHR